MKRRKRKAIKRLDKENVETSNKKAPKKGRKAISDSYESEKNRKGGKSDELKWLVESKTGEVEVSSLDNLNEDNQENKMQVIKDSEHRKTGVEHNPLNIGIHESSLLLASVEPQSNYVNLGTVSKGYQTEIEEDSECNEAVSVKVSDVMVEEEMFNSESIIEVANLKSSLVEAVEDGSAENKEESLIAPEQEMKKVECVDVNSNEIDEETFSIESKIEVANLKSSLMGTEDSQNAENERKVPNAPADQLEGLIAPEHKKKEVECDINSIDNIEVFNIQSEFEVADLNSLTVTEENRNMEYGEKGPIATEHKKREVECDVNSNEIEEIFNIESNKIEVADLNSLTVTNENRNAENERKGSISPADEGKASIAPDHEEKAVECAILDFGMTEKSIHDASKEPFSFDLGMTEKSILDAPKGLTSVDLIVNSQGDEVGYMEGGENLRMCTGLRVIPDEVAEDLSLLLDYSNEKQNNNNDSYLREVVNKKSDIVGDFGGNPEFNLDYLSVPGLVEISDIPDLTLLDVYVNSSPISESSPSLEPDKNGGNSMKEFLSKIRLESLESLMVKEKIDLLTLSEMSHQDLVSIGVEAFGDRHKILKGFSSIVPQDSKLTKVSSSSSKAANNLKLVCCPELECNKKFETTVGLLTHFRRVHKKKLPNTRTICDVCGKLVRFIGQHKWRVHNREKGKVCNVCLQFIKQDFRKHSGQCRQCPYCQKVLKKKSSLLKHIATHSANTPIKNFPDHHRPVQSVPLDLSPSKTQSVPVDLSPSKTKETTQSIGKPDENATLPSPTDSTQLSPLIFSMPNNSKSPEFAEFVVDHEHNCNGRNSYPGDEKADDLSYVSEYEEDDVEGFTYQRRCNKDELEKKLREIDGEGDNGRKDEEEFMEKFRNYLIRKTLGKVAVNIEDSAPGKQSTKLEANSTVPNYCRQMRNHFIPAFRRAYDPFSPSMLLDCSTEKNVLFKGKERTHGSKTDPIFMTTSILDDVLEKYSNDDGLYAATIQSLTSAAISLMKFVEFELGTKYDLYGPDPHEKSKVHSKMIQDYIDGHGIWKITNRNRKTFKNSKKILENYSNPNKEQQILVRYKSFLSSNQRHGFISEVLLHDGANAPLPTPAQYIKICHIVMSEIIMSTGVRPVVVLKLKNGPYNDAVPGFNPDVLLSGDADPKGDPGSISGLVERQVTVEV